VAALALHKKARRVAMVMEVCMVDIIIGDNFTGRERRRG
jgi:hypothetical protein